MLDLAARVDWTAYSQPTNMQPGTAPFIIIYSAVANYWVLLNSMLANGYRL